jgi:hypothetical protein
MWCQVIYFTPKRAVSADDASIRTHLKTYTILTFGRVVCQLWIFMLETAFSTLFTRIDITVKKEPKMKSF